MSVESNMSLTRHKFSIMNKLSRTLWNIFSIVLFKPFGIRFFKKYRVFILRCFGAKVSWKAMVNSSVKIWAPWNLEMGDYACLGPQVDCYNQGKISLGNNATVSQKVYLCASTHDIYSKGHELIVKPIVIHDKAWVAADAFIGPGVVIGEGAIVGARAAVFSNVEPWSIVRGNPARFIKKRVVE